MKGLENGGPAACTKSRGHLSPDLVGNLGIILNPLSSLQEAGSAMAERTEP